MKVAVLANSIQSGLNFLQSTRTCEEYNLHTRIVKDRAGITYEIVTLEEHMRQKIFDSYIKTPDYYSPEDFLKMRTR